MLFPKTTVQSAAHPNLAKGLILYIFSSDCTAPFTIDIRTDSISDNALQMMAANDGTPSRGNINQGWAKEVLPL